MANIIKKQLTARAKRDSGKGKLLEFNTNLAPVKAGPKNSNGPKGGSAKRSQRFNKAALYRAKGEKIV